MDLTIGFGSTLLGLKIGFESNSTVEEKIIGLIKVGSYLHENNSS